MRQSPVQSQYLIIQKAKRSTKVLGGVRAMKMNRVLKLMSHCGTNTDSPPLAMQTQPLELEASLQAESKGFPAGKKVSV